MFLHSQNYYCGPVLKLVQNKNNSSGSFLFQQAKLPVQLHVAKYCAFMSCSLAVSYLCNIVNLSNTWMEVEIKTESVN